MVVFLDCGNIDRMPVDFLKHEGTHILNIDHHHDNTRFGTVNLVVSDASCTAEIVYDLARELGAGSPPRSPTRMYVGLVTDTGRFIYQNTTADAHRMAAELIEAGVDTHASTGACTRTCPCAGWSCSSGRWPASQRYDDGAITAMLQRVSVDAANVIAHVAWAADDAYRAISTGSIAAAFADKASQLAQLAVSRGGGGIHR